MKLAHLAGLACGLALLLGACSSNNASGTTTGGSAGTGDNGGSDGGGMDGDNGDGGMDGGESTEEQAAKKAVELALSATTTSENSAARIKAARDAPQAWVDAAQDARDAADEDTENPAALGAASRMLADARAYQEEQENALSMHEGSFAWYGTQLARVALANGAAAMPGERTNTITKVVSSRTNSDGDLLDARLKSDTFKSLMYEDGDMVFSNSGDEFKVGGYVSEYQVRDEGGDTAAVTGLTLTSSGVVIRTGNFASGWDYTDSLKDITENSQEGGADVNRWDLTLTFDAPRPLTVAAGDDPDRAASWTGNSDFYWKGIAMADESQLKGGANYKATAFNQAAGFEDLGTYELWLSNHIGVDTNLEPEPGETAVCPGSGSDERKSACPEDDVNLYLSYAAYGMFAYSADPETFQDGTGDNKVGRHGRVSTMHFGYEAFADEDGKKTTDINEAITGATFSGQTTGFALRGTHATYDPATVANPFREKKPLRGDVSLTVSIPMTTGAGSLLGKIDNLEEWDGNSWKAYSGIVAVHLHADTGANVTTAAAIGDAGTFSGRATIQVVGTNAYVSPTEDGTNDQHAVGPDLSTPITSPAVEHLFNNGGKFTGNFYGPRTAADLEIAGSWRTGTATGGTPDSRYWSLFGSFGAKQAQQ